MASTSTTAAGVQGRGEPVRVLRVLVAEDHPVNQRLVAEILRERGHQATVAATGLEVLELLASQTFDVILMDGQMPDMDGYAATREIRRREARAGGHIPIIAVTAHVGGEQRQACLDAGMDDYISKPIDPDLLLDCLESAAGAGHGALAARQALVVARLPGRSDSAPLATPELSERAIFNRAGALERVRGRQVFLRQLNDMFMSELPNMMEAIGTAVARNDAVELELLAHRLRGAAITVGGEALAAAADAFEKVAGQGLLAEVPAHFAGLHVHAGQLCAALREFAAETPSASVQ